MANQYADQYKKETAQIHAPIDLIERTKAAIREEEKRLSREREAQEKVTETICEDEEKCAKRYPVRRWAYPLTAAAALLVLVSVSLTMKGLKDDGPEASGAAYEESADAGYAESAVLDIPAEENGGTDEMMEEGGVLEETDEAIFAEVTEGAVCAEPAAGAMAEAECEDAEEVEAAKEALERKKEAANVSFADYAVSGDGIMIEEAERKPDFCDLPDTETHVYEGTIFLVRKEENDWIAYVETESKTGYVLRGEAENLEEFLEAGREKLARMRGEE